MAGMTDTPLDDDVDTYQIETTERAMLYMRSIRFNLRVLAVLAVVWSIPLLAALVFGLVLGAGGLTAMLTG